MQSLVTARVMVKLWMLKDASAPAPAELSDDDIFVVPPHAARVRVRVTEVVTFTVIAAVDVRLRMRGEAYFHKPTHSASTHNKCTQNTSLVGCR